ncbi:hypothetical protein D3C72_2516920 [compost metagenome]
MPLGQQQPLRRLLLVGDLFKQAQIERIIGTLAQTGDTQFMDISAYTPAQLGSRGLGKGHDQQIFHAKGA